MRNRRAFGLVEMAFVLAMLAGVLALLFLIFHQQSSGARKLDAHQEALRAGLFALEAITRDLKALVTLPEAAERRYGDHRTPVRISRSGQQIAFFVPAPELPSIARPSAACWPVVWSLAEVGRKVGEATAKAFGVRRSHGTGADAATRELPEVTLRDLRFRLLEPDCPDAGRRSPDAGYYVQVMLEAVDREGKQVRPLPALVRLDFPSRQAELHGMETRLAYQAPVPLELAPETARSSGPELAAVSKLRDLSKQFEDGKLSANELEVAVQKALAPAAGQFTGARIAGPGVRVPNFAELSLKPHQPGEPIALSDPMGNVLTLLSSLTGAGSKAAPQVASSSRNPEWWVDLSTRGPEVGDLAGLMGTNSFGPLAGDEAKAAAAVPGALP